MEAFEQSHRRKWQYHSRTARYWWTYQRHCGFAGPRVTGARTSGIVRMLGPGDRLKSGHPPQGDQPEDWRAPSRGTVLTSGNPQIFFNTAGALKHVSLELYVVSAHVVRRWDAAWTSMARCPRSWHGPAGKMFEIAIGWLITRTPLPGLPLLARLFPGVCPRVC